MELEAFGGETVAVQRVPPELEQLPVEGWLPGLTAAADDEAGLQALAHAAASGRQGAPRRTTRCARCFAQLDAADFSVPAIRTEVVVAELPLLDLEARTGG